MIFNVTSLSQIYSCTSEEYQGALNNPLEYDEFGLYLVDTGLGVLNTYYGKRKLTDILGVTSLPLSPEYPCNKLYLYISKDEEDSPFVKDIYYKYQDQSQATQLATFSTDYLRSLEIDSKGHLVSMIVGNNDKFSLLVVEDGKLNEDTLKKILDNFELSPTPFVWHNWK